MIKIYGAKDTTEAHIVRGLLESRGIPAFVAGQYLQGGVGELPAIDIASVLVEEDYVEAARKIIDEYEQGIIEQTDD